MHGFYIIWNRTRISPNNLLLPSSGASGGSDAQNEDEDDLITRALGSGVKVRPPPHALVCGRRRRT